MNTFPTHAKILEVTAGSRGSIDEAAAKLPRAAMTSLLDNIIPMTDERPFVLRRYMGDSTLVHLNQWCCRQVKEEKRPNLIL